MFRPMRRIKNEISVEETKALLASQKRGVLAVNGDEGYPFAVPMNYFYDEANNKIYMHGAKSGHKVDSLKKDDKVCFTVYGNEHKEDDWAPYVQSTIVFGRCKLIDDDSVKADYLRSLARRYYPSEEEIEIEIKADMHAAMIYEITIEHMSGKQIHER